MLPCSCRCWFPENAEAGLLLKCSMGTIDLESPAGLLERSPNGQQSSAQCTCVSPCAESMSRSYPGSANESHLTKTNRHLLSSSANSYVLSLQLSSGLPERRFQGPCLDATGKVVWCKPQQSTRHNFLRVSGWRPT